ncbi:DUF4158 domain-containing protein [Salmonella enterica]|nr:DUF4158 domain-containing protein [Salmonella enterica]EHG6849084.1 DUF4158 domain-containing protein [Salmonella enterica]
MPVNFLSENQKAGYGNCHGEQTKETLARYFYLDDFDRLNISEKRGEHNRLGYAVLLCTVRYLGRFPDLTTIIPIVVIEFLAEQLHIESGSEQVNIYNSGKQRRQHIDEITKIYGYTEFTDIRVAFSLTRWLYSYAGPERVVRVFFLKDAPDGFYHIKSYYPDIHCSNVI